MPNQRSKYAVKIPPAWMKGRDYAPAQFTFWNRGMPIKIEGGHNIILNPSNIPMATFREMTDHPGVLFPLEMLKLPTIRSDFIYTNPDKDIETQMREVIRKIWTRLKRDTLTGYEYGFSAQEKRFYQDEDGFARYRRFTSLFPDYVKILADDKGIFQGFRQNVPGRPEPYDIPAQKAFLYTHNKQFGNLYGRSRLRAAHLPWIIDTEGYKFQGIAQQDFAVPSLVARAPMGKGVFSDGRGGQMDIWYLDFMQNQAESITSRGIVSVPSMEGFGLDPLFDRQTHFWDFNKDHEHMDNEMAKAVFAFQDIMTKGGGSYAKAKEQSEWLIEGIEALQEEMASEYIHPYIIEPLVLWNFWDGGKAKPPVGEFHFSHLSRTVKGYLKEVFKEVIKGHPDRVDVDELGAVLKVPLTKKQDNEMMAMFEAAFDLKVLDDSGKVVTNRRKMTEHFKHCYNKGIESGKMDEGISSFVPMPSQDLRLINNNTTSLIEVLTENKEPVNMASESKSFFALGRQRVKEFADNQRG